MKKNVIGKVIAVLCLICIVAVGAFSAKTTSVVDCADCEGAGYTHVVSCLDCNGEGIVEDEDCGTCEGAGTITYLAGSADHIASAEALEASKTTCETCAGEGSVAPDSGYYATFMALLPPLVAIGLALITKEVYSSLFVGIVLGGLLVANWKPVAGLDYVLNDGIISAVSGTAGIFIFLVILGAMVALINKAGGSAAFGRWAEKHIKSRVGAAFATFILGVLIFIDDYFNCLTVGSVMRPVTDRHKISRAKFAYLIDATAAPICMIAPVSSWAAAVSEFTKGTGYSGIELFVRAIPYNFYSLLTIVFIIAITLMKFDYGPMKLHEANAMEKGDLFTSGAEEFPVEASEANRKGKVIDLIFPIIVLVVISVIGLIYVGGFFSGETFINAFGNTDATVGLPWGAIIALIVTIVYLMLRRTVTFKEAMECIPKGFNAMVPAILILTFATALKNMTGLLGADTFVAGLMDSAAAGLSAFLPAIIFLVACVLAFATGTSWGTFGILIPIVTAMFPGNSELLIIGISACLAGAVCGDHCSPISDTTIMSSAGSQSNHLNHVSTQIPYAITVALISFVVYLMAAFIPNAWVLLPIGIVLTIATLVVIKNITAKKQ
ncbi:MAG: Na+/H+ antiporter NhaC family protein [Ruminococcaceae bacterium]|nr:Na+/H+ antiporter NhaC family protein [Oscillospiraceae bacterium]